jgi:Autotransporter beta-domain
MGSSSKQLFRLVILFLMLFVSTEQVIAQTCTSSLPFSQSLGQSCSDLNPTGTGTITNAGTISANSQPQGAIHNDSASITILTNTGTISNSSTDSAIYNNGTGSIQSIVNSGVITDTGPNNGIFNSGSIGDITNQRGGQINGNGSAIFNGFGGQITGTLLNYGTLSGTGQGINNTQGSSINVITNFGVIQGTFGPGIHNETGNIIQTLNNAQGGNNLTPSTTALTYSGTLPTNYNIIINSPTSYGQLAATSQKGGIGQTTFGIYTGSKISNGTYASVITNLYPDDLLKKNGTFGSASWLLSPEAPCTTSCIWDLIISGIYTGPSIANTNQSLVNTASALQGTYTLQNSVLANSFSYDCTVFGANDICVSAGGRNTTVQAANGLNNTSALLIAAYRPHPNYRIGAYADQNLSASNPGGTVNLGNNTPLIGLFAAWNERLDGTGTEVKVSAAYGQKNTTMTRSVVGSGSGASEAGSGSSTLNSQGTQLTAKYGFGVIEDLIVSPYVGMRYTQNNMAGYTESTSSSVTAPLTYSALNTNATTALAGVGASYRVIPTVMTFASAGVETDTNTANGTYSATNTSIGTLTPVNFNANPVKTRPTATVGAYYDIEKNQRLGITGIYRQEAYQAVSTTTVMATYTIGL